MSKTKRMLVALTLAVALGTLTAGPALLIRPSRPVSPASRATPTLPSGRAAAGEP